MSKKPKPAPEPELKAIIPPPGKRRDPLPVGEHDIPMDRIIVKPAENRSARASSTTSIEDLAKSIQANSLLQPIGVLDEPETDRFVLVFGERRFFAKRLLGHATIRANVTNKPDMVQQWKAAENIDREDPSELDKIIAVGRVLDQAGGDMVITAQRMGKSVAWVRDRQYVRKLPPKVLSWLAGGYLPLPYARELAKVSDPRRCEDIAHDIIGYRALESKTPGVGLEPFEVLQRKVTESMYSLKVVPWRLDVAFAGAPACQGCPSNTANDPQLFEGAPKEHNPEGNVCRNQRCFDNKKRVTQKAIVAGVEKVVDAKKKSKDLEVTKTGLGNLIPKIVRDSTFVRQAQKAVDPKSASKVAAAGKKNEPHPDAWDHPKQIAKRKFEHACSKWAHAISTQIVGQAFTPTRKAVLLHLTECRDIRDLSHWSPADRQKSIAKPGWRKLLSVAAKLDDEALKAVMEDAKIDAVDFARFCGMVDPTVGETFAKAFGVEVAKPAPKFEDFWSDDKKASAKSAKGKAGKGKKPGSSNDDGEDEE